METAPRDHRRYYALDAMRGVAALVVVCLHASGSLGGLPFPQNGGLAVDMFFVLSGFVIAKAYDQRIRDGLGFSQFLKIRVIRLYPLYIAGLVIGVLKFSLQFLVGVAPPLQSLLIDIGAGVLMLPSPSTFGLAFDPTFPINLPAWSLFFELIANIVYVLIARRLTGSLLVAILVVSGAALVFSTFAHGTLNIGGLWKDLPYGVPRVMFSFFLGVLIARFKVPDAPLPGIAAPILIAVLVFCLAYSPPRGKEIYELACVSLIFPALLIAGTRIQPGETLRRISAFLGDTSYAVYIIHLPLLTMVLAILKRLAPQAAAHVLSGPLFIVGLLALCYAADRFYDWPVRRLLTKWLVRARPRPAQVVTPQP